MLTRGFDAFDLSVAYGITEDQVQVLTDGLRMYFPHGIILQTPRDNYGFVEAVIYKPFEKPAYRIGKPLHPMPVVLTRGSGKAILSSHWLTPTRYVALKPWQQRAQEELCSW
jgi:hypothetical protein